MRGQEASKNEGDLLQCSAKKLYVRSDHSTEVQWKLLYLFFYASKRTTDKGADPLSVQPINIPSG